LNLHHIVNHDVTQTRRIYSPLPPVGVRRRNRSLQALEKWTVACLRCKDKNIISEVGHSTRTH
jgi:hypothetical protein